MLIATSNVIYFTGTVYMYPKMTKVPPKPQA